MDTLLQSNVLNSDIVNFLGITAAGPNGFEFGPTTRDELDVFYSFIQDYVRYNRILRIFLMKYSKFLSDYDNKKFFCLAIKKYLPGKPTPLDAKYPGPWNDSYEEELKKLEEEIIGTSTNTTKQVKLMKKNKLLAEESNIADARVRIKESGRRGIGLFTSMHVGTLSFGIVLDDRELTEVKFYNELEMLCSNRDAVVPKKKVGRCTVCSRVWYCSRECQVAHWGEHKKDCVKKPVLVIHG